MLLRSAVVAAFRGSLRRTPILNDMRKGIPMAKYGSAAKKEVKKAVEKTKAGTQKSGKSGKAKNRSKPLQ